MEEKLSLENSIRAKSEEVVEKILGNKDFIILVTVDIEQVQEEKPKPPAPAYPGLSMVDQEYLPGITYTYIPTESPLFPTNKAVIRKISVIVTIDTQIDIVLIDRIKRELFLLVGLDAARGDIINIQKIVFSKPKLTFRDFYQSWSGLFYWFVTLVFIGLFFLGPMRAILRTIARSMEIRVEADTRIRSIDNPGGMQSQLPGNSGLLLPPGGGNMDITFDRKRMRKEEEESNLKKRFGFINEANIKNLIFLLKKEIPSRIAIVTSYLPTNTITQIINSLTSDQQKEVFRNLSDMKLFDPEEVDMIEQDIKTKIDYLIGGENYFNKILDEVDRDTQENIIRTLEDENPALAEKLKKQLFYFEDIVSLDKTGIQKIIRVIQQTGGINMALALKTAIEDIKVKVMDCLTEGGKAILAEQMDLLGETQPKRVEEEQKKIVIIIKELIRESEIVFSKT